MKDKKTNRKYRPRTEAQKERRRYLDRLRREKARKECNKKPFKRSEFGVKCKTADKAKKMLKAGKVVTPKTLKNLPSKAKSAKPCTVKKLKDTIVLKSKHVVRPGEIVVFKDFTNAGIVDFGFRLLQLAVTKMMSEKTSVLKA